MKVGAGVYEKIRRRTAELGIRYESVPKLDHWDKIPYWYVWFRPGGKRYMLKGFLHEIALERGWITRDDLRQARGRYGIPMKPLHSNFWQKTWAFR